MAASEADSREKLAADVLRFVREVADEAYVMGAHEASWYPNIGSLRECIAAYLDRQAAITERECMERATSERVGWDCAKCAEGLGKYADSLCDPLKERIAELSANRDKLARLALGLWRRMDALRMAGIAPSKGDLDALAARLAEHGIEAS